jgi:outer membrane lipoprotein-sorting protein
LINAQNDVNHISFLGLEINPKLPPNHFSWTPPAGTRVIDTAQNAKSDQP